MEALIADEKQWALFQNACVFSALGTIAAVMTVANVITGQGLFAWITLGFSVACFVDLLLTAFRGIPAKIAMILFVINVFKKFI